MTKTRGGLIASAAAALLTACVTATTGPTGGGSDGGSSSSGGGSGSGSGGGSGGGSGESSTSAFVGTWTCAGTLSAVQTSPPGVANTSEGFSDDETLVANADGTLTLSFEFPDGGSSSDCTYTLSVAGSTASGAGGQPQLCLSEGDEDSFDTLKFEITSAGVAQVEYVVGVTGTTTDDAGAFVALAGTVTISGTCAKD